MQATMCVGRVFGNHGPQDNAEWKSFVAGNANEARWPMHPLSQQEACLKQYEGQGLLAAYRPVALAMLNGDNRQPRAMEGRYFDYWVPTGLFWTVCENHVKSPAASDDAMRGQEARKAVYMCQLHYWDDSQQHMANVFQVCKAGESWLVRINPDVCTNQSSLDPTGVVRVPRTGNVKVETSVPIKDERVQTSWNTGYASGYYGWKQ